MLKAQLRSKLSLRSLVEWQDCEDILTGDFFGVLDYLPRQPYLRQFLEEVERLNCRMGALELSQVDWSQVEMSFWPRCRGHDDLTEPDVVLSSNRWLIVVEVKLESGLGKNQPWREYCVGQQLAEDRGLRRDAVDYLIVSRDRLPAARVFEGLSRDQRSELEPRTLFLRWSEAVEIINRWRHGVRNGQIASNEGRMLADLYAALRRRRTLSFSEFSFLHQQTVAHRQTPMFCPPRFSGFLPADCVHCSCPRVGSFFPRFGGFLNAPRPRCSGPNGFVWLHRFQCFVVSSRTAYEPSGPIFCPGRFQGFLERAPHCRASAILKQPDGKE